jgi:NUMOD3 motif
MTDIFLDNKYTKWYYQIVNRANSRKLPKNHLTERHHIIPKSIKKDNSRSNLAPLTPREHFICHWLLVKMTTGEIRKKMLFAVYRMKKGNQPRYDNKITSRVYQHYREEWISCLRSQVTGEKNPMYGRKPSPETLAKIAEHKGKNKGYKWTDEQKERKRVEIKKRVEAGWRPASLGKPNPMKGKTRPPEFGKKVSKGRKGKGLGISPPNKGKPSPRRGIPQTPEHSKKIGDALRGKPKKIESIKKQQESLKQYLKNCPVLTCPHCGKSGKHPNFEGYHFDKCSVLTGIKRNQDKKGISPATTSCIHCGKIASKANITRHHNNNCKHKENKNEIQ